MYTKQILEDELSDIIKKYGLTERQIKALKEYAQTHEKELTDKKIETFNVFYSLMKYKEERYGLLELTSDEILKTLVPEFLRLALNSPVGMRIKEDVLTIDEYLAEKLEEAKEEEKKEGYERFFKKLGITFENFHSNIFPNPF